MMIRKATIKDILKINEIYIKGSIDEYKLWYPQKTRKELIKKFENEKKDRLNEFKKSIKKDYWVVVIDNDEIVAFGQTHLGKIEKTRGDIDKIYVLKEFRGKGIGTKIVKESVKWLKKHKAKTVWAGLYIKNKPSMNLSKKLGFKARAIVMEKRLK